MIESTRVDNLENFATEIIEKVTQRAMDIVDASNENVEASSRQSISSNCPNQCCVISTEPKNRNRSLRSARRSNERMKKICCTDVRENDETSRNIEKNLPNSDVNQRASEEIRKIVEGLRGVQIGDSTLVKPVKRVSSLERQVKRAVAEMQNDSSEISRMRNAAIAEGQGDVDGQIFHETVAANCVVETEYDLEQIPPAKIAKLADEPEKQIIDNEIPRLPRQIGQRLETTPEISKLRSTCFLHRMIKELEDAEAKQENVLVATTSASISEISQERIAAWEESEEKFIRTIEGTTNDIETSVNESSPIIENDSFVIYPLSDVTVEEIVDVKIEELDSKPDAESSTLTSPSVVSEVMPEACQSIGTMKKSMLLSEANGTLERTKTKNKKSVGAKLRKFFLSAFKRGKDT